MHPTGLEGINGKRQTGRLFSTLSSFPPQIQCTSLPIREEWVCLRQPWLMPWMRLCPISQGDVWHTNRAARMWFKWERLAPIRRSAADLPGQFRANILDSNCEIVESVAEHAADAPHHQFLFNFILQARMLNTTSILFVFFFYLSAWSGGYGHLHHVLLPVTGSIPAPCIPSNYYCENKLALFDLQVSLPRAGKETLCYWLVLTFAARWKCILQDSPLPPPAAIPGSPLRTLLPDAGVQCRYFLG